MGSVVEVRTKRMYSKPTREELERRIEMVATLIINGHHKYKIKQFCYQQWQVNWRTVESYITKARNRMVEEAEISIKEQVAEAMRFYQSVLSSPVAAMKDKIAARKQLDNICGLNRVKVEVTNASQPSGVADEAVLNLLSDEERAKIEEAQNIINRAIVASSGVKQAITG